MSEQAGSQSETIEEQSSAQNAEFSEQCLHNDDKNQDSGKDLNTQEAGCEKNDDNKNDSKDNETDKKLEDDNWGDDEPKIWIGFDLSTQQLKSIAIDQNLEIVCEASVNFDADLPEYR